MSSRTAQPYPVPPGNWSNYPASTAPNALDIVWCRFPESDLLKPAPKSRPGLVRRVMRNPTGQIVVEVTYGTSNLKLDRSIPHQLIISHRRDLEEAGLDRPTRFDLALTKFLPWCKEFFGELKKGNGAIIGRLSAVKRLDLNEMKGGLPRPSLAIRAEIANSTLAASTQTLTSTDVQPLPPETPNLPISDESTVKPAGPGVHLR
jgi:hypothetical protein